MLPGGSSKSKPRNSPASTTQSGKSIHPRGHFICVLHDMIEETSVSNPSIISWSEDGSKFIIYQDHAEVETAVEKYFGRK
jgi:hypothetical protein